MPLREARLSASACLDDGTSPRSLPLCRTMPAAVKTAMPTDWGRRGMRALSQGALPGPKRSAPLLPRVCDKATPGWRRCGISPLRPLLRRSTASCTCAHVCGAWPALRAAKSCLPRIFTSPTSRNRDVSVLTWGGAHLSVIVRILRAHDARVLTPLNNLVCFLSLFRTFGTFGIPPLAARPAMAVPPAKGLDEVCAWLHKAALTPFSHRSLN